MSESLFPTELDTFPADGPGAKPPVKRLESALKAVEAKLGKNGSAVTTSVDSKLAGLRTDVDTKADAAATTAALASKQATIPAHTYVPKFTPTSPKPGREIYLMDYLASGRTPGTTQDTSGFLAARTASPGNTLIISPGLYRVNDVIDFDGLDDVTVKAHGAVIILDDDGTATGRIIRARNCEGFRWFGGELRQTAAARTGLNGLLTLDVVDRFRVEIDIVGGSGTGVSLLTATNGRLEARTRDTKADGVHVNRGSAHCQVVNPYSRDSGDDGVAIVSDIGAPQTTDITVVNPDVSGSSTALGSGVVFVGAKDSSCVGGIVSDMPVNIGQVSGGGSFHAASNISFHGLKGRGVYRGFDIGPSTDTLLDGCQATGCSDVGVHLATGSVRAYVDGGKFTGNVGGIYETGGSGNHVHDADLRNNSGFASVIATATLVDCIT